MQTLAFIGLLLAILFSNLASVSPLLLPRDISVTYDNLVHYTKYCSAAYYLKCPRPLGNTLSRMSDHTEALIVRNDTREEIVLAFHGTSSLADAVTDTRILLVPSVSLGITEPAQVHVGFLSASNKVAVDVLDIHKAQHSQFPTYRIVATGHSLGGTIVSIAAPALTPPSGYTPSVALSPIMRQMRTGNAEFAAHVEAKIGVEDIFRDGVPIIGHAHFRIRAANWLAHVAIYSATEFWQFEDPGLFKSPHVTVRRCLWREDPTYCDSILSTGINPAHARYFGQLLHVHSLLVNVSKLFLSKEEQARSSGVSTPHPPQRQKHSNSRAHTKSGSKFGLTIIAKVFSWLGIRILIPITG
ncbi:Alpha/Beta hydrolase protein [Mycena epipterygia]|nr:Alpha/Beta hydrolase protein [Mycena epipterygia]